MTDNTSTSGGTGTPGGTETAGAARTPGGTGISGSTGAPGGAGTSAGVGKPTPADLGIDPAALRWERSGEGEGTIEIAFPENPALWSRGDWVLMRVAGDSEGRILVFDRNEWVCFLDGVRKGEFDNAAE